MDGNRRTRLMERIAAVAPDGTPQSRLCRGSVAILGVSSAALILMTDKEGGALAAASEGGAATVEDLQFALGEGPCIEAFGTGGPVMDPDLSQDGRSRWPIFAAAARDAGVEAVFAFPLLLGAMRLGVLYLCREKPGMLSDEQVSDAFALAQIATSVLLEVQMGAAPGDLGPGLDGEWAHRAVVHQATGMVSAQLDVRLADALARMRSLAFAGERSIYDVAADVVSRRIKVEP